jgi:CD109 antigen
LLIVVVAGFVTLGVVGCADSGGRANAGGLFDDKVDGYIALVPSTLRAGETASFSFTLTHGNRPARSHVTVALLDDDRTVVTSTARIDGTGTVAFDLPALEPGEYKVKVSATDFNEETKVQVQAGTLLFLETDKPIYKPGQTIQMRLVALNGELKPVKTGATVEVQDAKGIKIAKQSLSTDEYGMASMQLPLSSEPNLGVWKLTAYAGDASTQLDVRVEEYVLPKYEVEAELTKDWFLVDETITGRVSSKYSYGRIVEGELKVVAYRYVGEWEEYASYTAPIKGEGEFEIDPAGYVAGVPEAGGLGNVRLDITVTEEATGYQQTTTELLTVADSPLNVKLVPESNAFKPGLPFSVMVVTETPGGDPVEAEVALDIYYYDEDYNEAGHQVRHVETSRGTGLVELKPPTDAVNMSVSASSGSAYAGFQLASSYSPSGNFIHVQQTGDLDLLVGDTASFHVNSTAQARTFYYEVVARGRVVFTSSAAGDFSFKVTPAMTPSAKLLVYQILPSSEVAADALPFDVQGDYPQDVSASFNVEQANPGDEVTVAVQTEGSAKVGVVAVDHSVFILAENRLNLEQVFAELERLYMQPQAELHEGQMMWDFPTFIPGAKDTFEDAGLIVLSNKDFPEGKELEQRKMWLEDGVGRGGGGAPPPGGGARPPPPAPGGPAAPAGARGGS